ncbi:hypothetical protein [Streptomyces flavofungini]|nr:hypothetical protein [Streptomyces flavofungini]WJV47224.1 hypothetical protein QUY26_17900 [Streptomyces flavofungini]
MSTATTSRRILTRTTGALASPRTASTPAQVPVEKGHVDVSKTGRGLAP